MTWNVDEYLDKTLRGLSLCPGVSVCIDTADLDFMVDINIHWHRPSINLNWYPVCQIDVNNKTIFQHEGSENPEHWHDLLDAAADRLKDYIKDEWRR